MSTNPSTVRRLLATAAAGLLSTAGILTFASAASASDGGGQFTVDILSATNVNPTAETVTLPLLQGSHNGQPVYYVVTDDSDQADAQARGVNYGPKLAHALGTAAVQQASVVGGVVQFPGIVDFSPTRVVTPGPAGNEFAGGSYAPGAVGDAIYSPLITTGNGIVLDATQIADASGVHDFAPNLDSAPGVGSNDPDTSARSAIIPVVNGAVGAGNPNRQGLNSALRGEGDPLNINQEIPGQGNGRYSPVWDVHPLAWTQAAIDSGQRVLLTSGSQVAGAFSHGRITSAGSGPANPSLGGLRAGNFISNCPIVAVA